MIIPLPETIPQTLTLRYGLQLGDMGAIIQLHGTLYAKEYGYDQTFESYVAAGLAEFAQSFSPDKDRVWIVEEKGEITGSIAIVGRSKREAQLRWFLIHPKYRGLGLGRILLKAGLQFCKEQGYENVFLWTIQNLAVATHLYRSFGFQKTDEKIHPLWGKMVHEERYDLTLDQMG
jgi:N-acetylglutamate synthase-like GNAT family acetyltransferase